MTAIKSHITRERLTDSLIPLEKSVLGCVLVDPNRAAEVELAPYMFPNWRSVAEKLFIQIEQTGTADAQTLAYECKRAGICDKQEVYSLIGAMVQDRFEDHAATLRKEWIRREEIGIHQEVLSKLQAGEDVATSLRQADAEREVIHGFADDKHKSRVRQAGDFLDTMHKRQRGELPTGYKIGVPAFDNLSGGLGIPNRIRILAARPGMGKSTFLYQCATAAAKAGCPTVIFSLETLFGQMMETICQQRTGIPRSCMQRQDGLNEAQLRGIQSTVEWYYDLPLFVEDSTDEFGQVCNKIRQYVRKYGVKLVFIDYLQLIQDRTQRHYSKTLEVEAITRGLTVLALQEGIDIICLSQLSRAVETRGGDKRPMMSDLRHSGSIEQDAGQIWFLYRPDYYGILEDEEGQSLKGALDVIQAKDRYAGKIGEVRMWYNAKYNFYQPGESDEEVAPPAYNPNVKPTKPNTNDRIPF